MTNKDLANLLYPNVTMTIDDLEKKYPKRNLPEGAEVTRFAPSPTGFVHMGSLYGSLIANWLAAPPAVGLLHSFSHSACCKPAQSPLSR